MSIQVQLLTEAQDCRNQAAALSTQINDLTAQIEQLTNQANAYEAQANTVPEELQSLDDDAWEKVKNWVKSL